MRFRLLVALLLPIVGSCSAKSGTGPTGLPAVVLVTVIQPPAATIQYVGFPTMLPRGTSTLLVAAIDSTGVNMVLDPAQYRFDVVPLVVPGLYTITLATNTNLGAQVLSTGTVPITWKLTDITTGRIAVGPTVTNVLLP